MSQETEMPAYELLAQCYIDFQNDETGQVGPTLLEVGQVIYTEAMPCDAWKPLNAAAERKIEEWHKSLPVDGKNVLLEDLTEAAAMMRPREGDKEIDHQAWSAQVMVLAQNLADKRRKMRMPKVAAFAPGRAREMPIMPGAAHSVGFAPEMARPAGKVHMPPSRNTARGPRTNDTQAKPAMAGTPGSNAPAHNIG
jgi:hypothetical protein